MNSTMELDEATRVEALWALRVLVLAQDPRTADLVHGVETASVTLIEALESDPPAWAAWIEVPDHANAAASLQHVLTEPDRARLAHAPNAGTLLEALDAVERQRSTVRALARELAPAAQELTGEVIDLRERQSEPASK